MYGDLADESPLSGQERLTLSQSMPLFFQDWPMVLEPGSSGACVGEVRGSERGRAASNFSGKPTSIPEGSRSCSGAH